MSETFMTAGTKMEDLVSKKEKLLDSAGGLVAEAVIGRAKERGIKKGTLLNDIENLIRRFDEKEKTEILKTALFYMASNGNYSRNTDDDDDYGYSPRSSHSRSGLFGR